MRKAMAMVMPTVIDLIVFVLALAALNLPVSSCSGRATETGGIKYST